MRAQTDKTRSGRAYTLFELMMLIVIIGVAAAVAVPAYSGASARYRVSAAATRLTTDLIWAREMARLSSAEVFVVFDTSRHEYRTTADDPTAPGKPYEFSLADRFGAQINRTNIKSINGPTSLVMVFDKWGRAMINETPRPDDAVALQAAEIELRVGDASAVVSIDPVSGRAVLP